MNVIQNTINLTSGFSMILKILLIAIGAYIIIKLLYHWVNRIEEKYDIDMTVVYILNDIFKYFVLIIAIAWILEIFGINIKGIILSLGIVGVALGIASKDIVIAFDGDADRCLAVDENGEIMDGDAILAICAKNAQKEGKLKNNTLVATIMSNMGLKKFCKDNGIEFSETKVGDRYVLERMLKEGHSIGGEQSGHVIFLDHSTTGDGELTAVKLLSVLSCSGKKASELKNEMKKYPQKSSAVLIDISQKGKISKSKNINDYIEKITKELEGKGRIVLRESGTEPKIRIMFEHEDERKLDSLIQEAKKVVEKNLK